MPGCECEHANQCGACCPNPDYVCLRCYHVIEQSLPLVKAARKLALDIQAGADDLVKAEIVRLRGR